MPEEVIDYNALKKRGLLKQRQDGFFVLRTKMSPGTYSKEQLEKLASIAHRYARGFVHLTVRQGMEIPFIQYKDIPSIEKELKESGIPTGASGQRLRATICCPGNNWCKAGLIDTFSLVDRIENELHLKCGLDLPHKFKIAISGCPNACTGVQFSEIGIHGQIDIADPNKRPGYTIYLAGCGGRRPRTGFKLNRIFCEDETLCVVGSVVKFFKENAKQKQRLALLVEDFGRDNFLRYLGFNEGIQGINT